MSIPSLYLHSKLFHRPVRDVRDNSDRDRKVKIKIKSMPDSQFEKLEPDPENGLETAAATTKKATDLLRAMAVKANPGSTALLPQTEGQRATQYSDGHSTSGIRGVETPDLPNRGAHWPESPEPKNENVDKPPINLVDQEPDADKAVQKIMQGANEEAKKAFVAAPRFSPGPFVAPREKQFLQMHGYSDEDIDRGFIMPPRLRAAFNKWLTATVQKSIGELLS